MADCFNPTCKCKDLAIVREIILRCSNCHCAVKVESIKLDPTDMFDSVYDQSLFAWNSEDCERLLFTVMKNAK